MLHYLEGIKLSKWQIALLVGTPILVGTSFYIYKKTSGSFTKGDSKDADHKKFNLNELAKDLGGTNNDREVERNKKSGETDNGEMTALKEATLYKMEGNNCYKNGKYDEAISFYDKAIAKCPTDNKQDLAIFYQNRAAAYEMLKKWKCVKEDCTTSLQYNPKYSKAYFRRAKANEATNDILESLDDITATCVLEKFENNNTIIYADRLLRQMGRMQAEKAMKNRKPVLPSNNFIHTYFISYVNDPIMKMKLPESARENPSGFVKAKMALEEGRYEHIISLCTEELENSESQSEYKSEALLLRGTFHLLAGSYNEANKDLSALVDNDAVDVKLKAYAYIRRAGLRLQCESREECFANFKAAEELQPGNADVYHQRAQIFILLDQMKDAFMEFNKAVKLAPEHAMAHIQRLYADYRIAIITGDQLRLINVMNDFQNAIVKFPNNVDCYGLLAQVLSDQQQYAQADQYYEKAISIAPGNASLYVHRAIMFLQWKGDVDGCIDLMNRALEVDEKCELVYETMGTIEVQRANLERAVELFERAILYAKNVVEMTHLYSLRHAALAQINVTRILGVYGVSDSTWSNPLRKNIQSS